MDRAEDGARLHVIAAIETEELIRARPMDAVVVAGGCDRTVPAQLMAAASAKPPFFLHR